MTICDVFGHGKDVQQYCLTLRTTADNPGCAPPEFNMVLDLSGRAVKRAVKLLKRATTPPVKRGQQDAT